MMLSLVVERKGVDWLNLDRVVNFGFIVVELPGCVASFTNLTALFAVQIL